MKKQIMLVCAIFLISYFKSSAQLIDSFSDGDFSTSPTWNGDTGSWQVVTNSDVSSGATNSYTLRLNHAISEVGSKYLSTQISTMSSTIGQSWSLWIGRRAQAYTAANNVEIWIYANESNLKNTTVDGYAVTIGDDSGGDEIRLVRMTNGAVASTIITSSSSLSNNLSDIGFMIRVTRSNSGGWNLYTSTLPSSNGTGDIATALPSASNVNTSQGSETDNTYSVEDNGYIGIVAIHTSSSSARAAVELDQIYFDTDESAPLPVEFVTFTALMLDNKIKLNWITSTEINNYGFEVERSDNNLIWEKIGFVAGNGNSNSIKEYSFFDDKLKQSGTYYYRLKQIDNDGSFEYSNAIEVDFVVANDFYLYQNYPNPFNPTTEIRYSIPSTSFVRLEVFNVQGEIVYTLVNQMQESGNYSLNFDGSKLPSGNYFIRLQANDEVQLKKITLMK